jgi:Aldo/keto reductase family
MTTTHEYRDLITLGGDLQVGRIGYGAMRLTGTNRWDEYPDRDGGIALLRQAIEAGVTLIDTADVYGPHGNELLIREALHPYPEHLIIATKGGFVRGGPDYSTIDAVGNANYLRQSAHMSARRLDVEQIDLYYLHSGWAKDASFEDQVGTLADLPSTGPDPAHRSLERDPRSTAGRASDRRYRRRHRPFQCFRSPRDPASRRGARRGRRLCPVATGVALYAGLTHRHRRSGGGPSRPRANCVPARGPHLANRARLATGAIA